MATKLEPHPGKQRVTISKDVGPRLRTHREQQGLGLRELARRLGISASAVSQIETGKSRPSVGTLYAMANELDMSLDELFTDVPAGRPEKHPVGRATPAQAARSPAPAPEPSGMNIQRAGTRKSLELESGVRWERLTSQTDLDAHFVYVVYDVSGSSSLGDRFIRYSGYEYGLVLSGRLEVTVGFESCVLGPGDSISFNSAVPHFMRNVGDEPVHGVWFAVGRHEDSRALAFEEAGRNAPGLAAGPISR